jgi:hypothetical protein
VRPDGATVNLNFAHFAKPMGLTVNRDRLLIGTETGIREFRNIPAVAERLDPPGRHDGVYVYRKHHVTGDINIHEMALGTDNECWFVNTRFSCLCTLDVDSASCRVGVQALFPDFLPTTDVISTAAGHGERKAALARHWERPTRPKAGPKIPRMAVSSSITRRVKSSCADCLCPHSPRWYRNRFWILESGRGSLATIVGERQGKHRRAPSGIHTRTRFRGSARFRGTVAIAETNPLTDIPITEENVERMSGVWVVNIETGETIAILKFGDAVQEIFAVQAIPGVLFPEILDEDVELLQTIYALPNEAYRDVRYMAPSVAT